MWIHPAFSVQGGGQHEAGYILSAIYFEDQELPNITESAVSLSFLF